MWADGLISLNDAQSLTGRSADPIKHRAACLGLVIKDTQGKEARLRKAFGFLSGGRGGGIGPTDHGYHEPSKPVHVERVVKPSEIKFRRSKYAGMFLDDIKFTTRRSSVPLGKCVTAEFTGGR